MNQLDVLVCEALRDFNQRLRFGAFWAWLARQIRFEQNNPWALPVEVVDVLLKNWRDRAARGGHQTQLVDLVRMAFELGRLRERDGTRW